MQVAQKILLAQAAYYVITGVWPLVSIRTFMMVTGPKHDLWLVKAVGLLITAVGLSIGIQAAWFDTKPALVLAISSALALGFVDIWYSLRGVISKVYLVDGVIQILLIIALAISSASK
jgi:hypothetical protein